VPAFGLHVKIDELAARKVLAIATSERPDADNRILPASKAESDLESTRLYGLPAIARGERRGRLYVATPALLALNNSILAERKPAEDPFKAPVDESPGPLNRRGGRSVQLNRSSCRSA
jgi:hypothetical protein